MNEQIVRKNKKPAIACFYFNFPKGSHPGGCEIYRGNMPLTFLREQGWNAQWFYKDELLKFHLQLGEAMLDQMANTFDVFVIPRMYAPEGVSAEPFVKMIRYLKARGKKVVYEVDDDLTNEHRQVIPGDAMVIAKEADVITASTPYLADLMQSKTGLKTYILPNMISPTLWRGSHVERTLTDDQVLIGLTGSRTHHEDWRVLETVIPRILDEFPNVHFLLGGYHPYYFDGLPRTERIPPINYLEYAQMVKACDIILAPVIPDDPFNQSKSPIKVIEGMGAERKIKGMKAGAACVATDNAVYRLAIKHGVNGLLAQHTPESWYEQIVRLITDVPYRHRLQRKGYDWVWQHHNMAVGWRKWANTYSEILAS